MDISTFSSYSAHFGYVFDPEEEEVIDETILLIMRAPHTYTREDIVEFQCHGGMFVLNRVLEVVLKHGARPAAPGEFTKRAYLNGRIDLTQAEAVLSLIEAVSDEARRISLVQLSGGLSKKLKAIEDKILTAISWLEAIISFPDEDITPLDYKELLSLIDDAIGVSERLLSSYQMGKILTKGVKTVIVGRPNVGKSSLLNALLSEDRAIVTPIAGTTRDSLRESVIIDGIRFNLVDTAGIVETEHPLDRMGVERSVQELSDADLVLFVVDSSEKLREEDKKIVNFIKNKNVIIILNKSDLPSVVDKSEVATLMDGDFPLISVSAKTEEGLEDLKKIMVSHVIKKDRYGTRGEVFLTNLRHKKLLENTLFYLKKAREALLNGIPIDLIGLDLEEALRSIYQITGKEYVESVIETVFENFCVGK